MSALVRRGPIGLANADVRLASDCGHSRRNSSCRHYQPRHDLAFFAPIVSASTVKREAVTIPANILDQSKSRNKCVRNRVGLGQLQNRFRHYYLPKVHLGLTVADKPSGEFPEQAIINEHGYRSPSLSRESV